MYATDNTPLRPVISQPTDSDSETDSGSEMEEELEIADDLEIILQENREYEAAEEADREYDEVYVPYSLHSRMFSSHYTSYYNP